MGSGLVPHPQECIGEFRPIALAAAVPYPNPDASGPKEPPPGFEPGTYALRKHRSTAELRWRFYESSEGREHKGRQNKLRTTHAPWLFGGVSRPELSCWASAYMNIVVGETRVRLPGTLLDGSEIVETRHLYGDLPAASGRRMNVTAVPDRAGARRVTRGWP